MTHVPLFQTVVTLSGTFEEFVAGYPENSE
jgi:hypothetical protein